MDLQAGGVDAVLIDRVVGEYKIAGMGATDIQGVASLVDDNSAWLPQGGRGPAGQVRSCWWK